MKEVNFKEKFDKFLTGCEVIIAENHKRFASLRSPWFEIHHGNRYIKIVQCNDWNKDACVASGRDPKEGVSRRVHAFVDKTNGDVLKPATWRAPANHARGNIFDAHNGLEYVGAYGPFYLEQIKELTNV